MRDNGGIGGPGEGRRGVDGRGEGGGEHSFVKVKFSGIEDVDCIGSWVMGKMFNFVRTKI